MALYGWRARIGIIYPASGGLDQEFWKFVPYGVTILVTRITAGGSILEKVTREALLEMTGSNELEKAAQQLRFARADAIAFAETSATFVRGKGYDTQVAQRISDAAGGIPATTTSTAAVEALRALRVNKVAIGSPYPEDISELLRRFMSQNGFQIVSMKMLGIANAPEMQKQAPAVSYSLGKQADAPEAEALFIPCADLRTAEIIQALEDDLGKPVITANQATMWKVLRLAGVNAKVKGYGKLLETH